MSMKIRINTEKFETLLNKKLITQSQLAKKARITPEQISRMKHPKKHGTKITAQKILRALKDVNFDDIFFECY